jgi:hypothetical protein
MSKRPSLAETMRHAATAPDPPAPAPVAAQVKQPAAPGREIGFYAATRVGKKKVTATLPPADHKRLRQLALERDATTEALLTEAISDLFAKYGKAGVGQGKGAS